MTLFLLLNDQIRNEEGRQMFYDGLNWDFSRETRWMYNYLYGKLNTELFDIIGDIDGNNGFEVYRVICRHVDKVPDNMRLHLDVNLMKMIEEQSSIKNLKDTYLFRVKLTKKAGEYDRAIGRKPDSHKLKEILWTVADFGTKQAAVTEKVKDIVTEEMISIDQGSYDDLGKFIDKRYRLQYGVLDFGKKSSDDMDLSAVEAAAAEAAEEAERLANSPGDLDAMGKGGKGDKGAGKGVTGKQCFCCQGFNHLSNNCPTPKDSTATHKCYNC